jgi:hypothetical protein
LIHFFSLSFNTLRCFFFQYSWHSCGLQRTYVYWRVPTFKILGCLQESWKFSSMDNFVSNYDTKLHFPTN